MLGAILHVHLEEGGESIEQVSEARLVRKGRHAPLRLIGGEGYCGAQFFWGFLSMFTFFIQLLGRHPFGIFTAGVSRKPSIMDKDHRISKVAR